MKAVGTRYWMRDLDDKRQARMLVRISELDGNGGKEERGTYSKCLELGSESAHVEIKWKGGRDLGREICKGPSHIKCGRWL